MLEREQETALARLAVAMAVEASLAWAWARLAVALVAEAPPALALVPVAVVMVVEAPPALALVPVAVAMVVEAPPALAWARLVVVLAVEALAPLALALVVELWASQVPSLAVVGPFSCLPWVAGVEAVEVPSAAHRSAWPVAEAVAPSLLRGRPSDTNTKRRGEGTI